MSHQEFFQVLKKDHEKLTGIIQAMKSQAPMDSVDMVVQLKRELMPHQEAEKETFYKALSRMPDAHRLALKAEEEHHVTETVLSELEKTPSGDHWAAKLDVLEDLIQEHIQKEESRAFQAAGSINDTEINDILHNFQNLKLQIKSNMISGIERESDARSGHLPEEDLGTVV